MFATHICARIGKVRMDIEARIPGWLRELNLVLHNEVLMQEPVLTWETSE